MDTWSWKFDQKFHTSYSTFVPRRGGVGGGGGRETGKYVDKFNWGQKSLKMCRHPLWMATVLNGQYQPGWNTQTNIKSKYAPFFTLYLKP